MRMTRFVQAMAHTFGRILITVAGHEDMTSANLLGRAVGSAGHTGAATLVDLSPQMDELFLSALAELATPSACG